MNTLLNSKMIRHLLIASAIIVIAVAVGVITADRLSHPRSVGHVSGSMGPFDSKAVARDHFGGYAGIFIGISRDGWRIVSTASGDDLSISLANSTAPEKVVFHAHFVRLKAEKWGVRWEADVSAEDDADRRALMDRLNDALNQASEYYHNKDKADANR